MEASRATSYVLLMGVTVAVAALLHSVGHEYTSEYVGVAVFAWSYYLLTKAPSKGVDTSDAR
jgi:hypothetical protein